MRAVHGVQAVAPNPPSLTGKGVRAARYPVRQGHAQACATGQTGMTMSVMELPAQYQPDQFVAGVPFYPM